MPFFENILVFFNEEFAGIKKEVVRLARHNQAALKIIDVFDNFDEYLEVLPPSTSVEELKELIIAERRREILEHFEEEPDIAERVVITSKFGNPAVEIIREVLRSGHDLVIKAATGNKTLSDRLFGNIAVKLLRKCPCPVLIVKPSDKLFFQKILAPVDPEAAGEPAEKTDDPAEPMSKKILDISVFLARVENSRLDILHCWFLPGESMLASGRARIEPDRLNHMRMLGEKIHTQRINALLDGYDLKEVCHSVNVLKGDPGEMIVNYAENNDTDLIVMGSVGRSGLMGLLIGSTAEKVIERVNCSVLKINPDNFKSPVTL